MFNRFFTDYRRKSFSAMLHAPLPGIINLLRLRRKKKQSFVGYFLEKKPENGKTFSDTLVEVIQHVAFNRIWVSIGKTTANQILCQYWLSMEKTWVPLDSLKEGRHKIVVDWHLDERKDPAFSKKCLFKPEEKNKLRARFRKSGKQRFRCKETHPK